MPEENAATAGPPLRSVPVDWEALEDAFENNAPEVHSYLHLQTGEVLRIVDGVADPQMHARIAADANYLRIDPVSSREQYRWMERYIPMVEDAELRAKLAVSIDGKGAFRRFKDVLMSYATERERWFAFRSERLRIFMEAWLNAHALRAVPRPVLVPEPAGDEAAAQPPEPREVAAPESREGRRPRGSDALRKALREATEMLNVRELETLAAFAEFLKSCRTGRSVAQNSTGRSKRETEKSKSQTGSESSGRLSDCASSQERGAVMSSSAAEGGGEPQA